jgi:hypothetical protein
MALEISFPCARVSGCRVSLIKLHFLKYKGKNNNKKSNYSFIKESTKMKKRQYEVHILN